ncbi:MAG: sulfur carrier protein ThiS [Thermogutta sp.]
MSKNSATVTVLLNGEKRAIPAGTTVEALLRQLDLAGKPVAVERNLEVVPRSQYAETEIQVGDRLEIVTLVGGG